MWGGKGRRAKARRGERGQRRGRRLPAPRGGRDRRTARGPGACGGPAAPALASVSCGIGQPQRRRRSARNPRRARGPARRFGAGPGRALAGAVRSLSGARALCTERGANRPPRAGQCRPRLLGHGERRGRRSGRAGVPRERQSDRAPSGAARPAAPGRAVPLRGAAERFLPALSPRDPGHQSLATDTGRESARRCAGACAGTAQAPGLRPRQPEQDSRGDRQFRQCQYDHLPPPRRRGLSLSGRDDCRAR